MKTWILCSFTMLFLVACDKEKVEYTDTITCGQQSTLTCTVLTDKLLLSFPTQIEQLDSLLIVADCTGADCFHLFDTTGLYLTSFGTKGRGPGELIAPGFFSITPQRELAVYDYSLAKIVTYQIDSLAANKKLCFKELSLRIPIRQSMGNTAGIESFRITEAIQFSANKYFLVGNSNVMRYGWFENDSITKAYDQYPDCLNTENVEDVWSLFGATSRIRISPDRKRIVHATYIGAIVQLFSISDNGAIENDQDRYIYEPKYGIAQGAVPRCVVSDETTVFGFHDLCVTDQSIFALINEQNSQSYPNYITELDWQGDPKGKFLTSMPLVLICGNGLPFYALSADAQSNEYSLIALQL